VHIVTVEMPPGNSTNLVDVMGLPRELIIEVLQYLLPSDISRFSLVSILLPQQISPQSNRLIVIRLAKLWQRSAAMTIFGANSSFEDLERYFLFF
jgi:hypothetical protein